MVRQSFSHGRSKAVVVEKVKRRIGPGEAKPEPVAAPDRSAAAPKRTGAPAAAPARSAAPAAASSAAPAVSPKASGVVLRTLTDDERSARAQALAGAQLREHEERERAEEEARVRRTPRRSRIAPNAPPRKRASATKKTAASTTKKPSARPTRSPRSVSAPISHRRSKPARRVRRSKPTRTRLRVLPAAAPAALSHGRRRRPSRPAPASAVKSAAAD